MRERADTISIGNAPAPAGGWSQRELYGIERIRAVCRKRLEFESGKSDEGDPWCIIWDREGERVMLHFARIDHCYVIAWPCRSVLQRATSITAATDFALRGLDRELHEQLRAGHAA